MTDASPGETKSSDRPPAPGGRLAAAAVHAFTASGSVCAFAAALAVIEGHYRLCFLWLGIALFIDGIDGTFARLFDVKGRLPRFSGDRLDNIVDYVTYVFVPTLAMYKAGLLGDLLGLPLSVLILMSSLYHFIDEASKADDYCFVGFPAIWNVVAFYLFAFSLPAWAAVAVVLVCAGLTFVPMRWLHPMRVRRLFWVNIGASVVWLLAAAQVLWSGFPAGPVAGGLLLVTGGYLLVPTLTRPMAPTSVDQRV